MRQRFSSDSIIRSCVLLISRVRARYSRRLLRSTSRDLYKMQSVFRAGLFEGKVAIVTGGGTGIGKAIARELLYLGSKVVISSRKEERLQKAADELSRYIQPSSSSEVKVVPCNIREEQQVNTVASKGCQ